MAQVFCADEMTHRCSTFRLDPLRALEAQSVTKIIDSSMCATEEHLHKDGNCYHQQRPQEDNHNFHPSFCATGYRYEPFGGLRHSLLVIISHSMTRRPLPFSLRKHQR
jgi:hypothetical protein